MGMNNNGGNGNGFRPINLNFGSNNSNNGSNGQNSTIGTIIFIILICIYVYNAMHNPEGYTEYTETDNQYNEYANNTNLNNNNNNTSSYGNEEYGNSLSWYDLIFGSATGSSNQDYASYEDTSIKNVSSEKYTMMIYMCGSNLESDGGYASSDLEEMLKATIADEINVIVYTGGSKKWFDYGISSKTNQIYQIKDHKVNLVKDNLGLENMASASTLSSFLKFCKTNYPADKYALIMWDHGGGAVSGFGLDENASRNDNLTIDEIKTAVDSFGSKLEFVGFDACLMANVETAYALKNGAKYFIASEETEPGTGWDYIKILNNLSKDSSQNGATTGRVIVDSFIASNSSYRNPDATLSVVDLSKMDNVYSNLVSFMKDVKSSSFDKKKYNTFSRTIANTKAFGDSKIDTIDLIDFAKNSDNKYASKLVSSVQNAISYNKTNQYVENANGLSIYIPYRKLSDYDKMLKIYKNIGMGNDYTSVLTEYVNLMAGGKKPTYQVNNSSYSQGTSNYSAYDWFDSLFVSRMSSYYEETALNSDDLEVEDKGDYFVLHLSKNDWEKITKVESVVWYDDGKGYIDMGVDSYYELDSNGDLKVEFDGTWLAINGDNIHYEVIERTDNYEKGFVPAVINKELVYLVLYFDKKNPDGEVLGYIPDYEETNQTLYEKGIRPLKQGDKIDFAANYYKYSGELDKAYLINETLEVGSEPLKVSYEELGEGECRIYYRLTDIYNNVYYTEPVIVY